MIGGLPRVAAHIQKVRAEVEAEGAGLVVVDAGDWFQGTPEGMIEDGLRFVEAMHKLRYDGAAVGNHEFDHGVDSLSISLGASGLPALCANVRDHADRPPMGARRYKLVQRAGMDIALVGLLTPKAPDISHPSLRGYRFESPSEALSEVREELERTRVDDPIELVLPLTHLGVDADRQLARAHPDLPLIVGGHTHTVLKEGVREGDVLIVQTGSKGTAIGRVDLWFDEAGALVESRAQLIELLDEPEQGDVPADVAAACAALVERASTEMGAVVGRLATSLDRSRDPLRSSTAGNWITDVMRERAEAQVALQNRGGIRRDVPAGEVTRRDLFELLPFGNYLATVEMTGAQLEACLRRSVEGMAHTPLEVSGIQVLYHPPREGESSAQYAGALLDGRAIDPEEVIKVATNTFLATGGDGYIEFTHGERVALLAYPLRRLLEEALQEKAEYVPVDESRFVQP